MYMGWIDYRGMIKELGARKSMGQNFLISEEIAALEANYAKGLSVVELGPGVGILTRELCKSAKSVIAIEKDARLMPILERIGSGKLRLIKADFFAVERRELKPIDIMVSNIPYNLSSKVIYWLGERGIPALICIQKEFAEHMLASPGTRDYSKLSVISSLLFRVHRIKDVPAANFYPKPRVDSCMILPWPQGSRAIDVHLISTISLIMNHKKKRLGNAVVDSASMLGMDKRAAREISLKLQYRDSRPLHMEPEKILETAIELDALVAKLKE